MSEPLLDVRGVRKSYSGQVALAGVDFAVERGEVHALVGENGSGKSTLIKTIAGYQPADSYSYATVEGEPFDLGAVDAAVAGGLRFIHQNLGLLPNMSAIENCAIARGFHTARGYRIRWKLERRRVHDLLLEFGVDIDPTVPVVELRPAERTAVAIVRALQDWERSAKLLVLDESTASLPPPEVMKLFGVIRQVAARGIGVVYVSHRLAEIFDIADRVSVLRDGANVSTSNVADITEQELISAMIGRPADLVYAAPPPPSGRVALEVNGLSSEEVTDVTFTVNVGEIVGFAGILGSGRESIASLLSGATAPTAGSITVGTTTMTRPTPRDAVDAGIVLVPADRGSQGLIADHSVTENMTLADLGPITKRGRISRRTERDEVLRWIGDLSIKAPSPHAPVSTLSGGNQQKVVLAKWLRTGPRVLVLDEPAHGVDVGAKAAIYQLVADRLREGMAVVMCSTESEDLAHLCDRVFVLRNGSIAAELMRSELSADRITREALGAGAADILAARPVDAPDQEGRSHVSA